MVRFLLKATLFGALVWGGCAVFEKTVAPLIRNPNNYVLATLAKEHRLATLPGSRLVIVGGSNVAFGLDSRQLGEAVRMPVVNMGVHGGLGLTFMLAEARQGIRKNDLVVLSLEYYLDTEGDVKLQTQLVDGNPAASALLPKAIGYRIRLIRTNYQRCLSSLFYALAKPDYVYSFYDKRYFTSEGDATGYLRFPQPRDQTGRDLLMPRDYNAGILAMNNFIDEATDKGATVVFVFPSYARSMYLLNRAAIQYYHRQIQATLHCSILNTPELLLFDDKYLFDTVYHLNKDGKVIRTGKMIGYLAKITH